MNQVIMSLAVVVVVERMVTGLETLLTINPKVLHITLFMLHATFLLHATSYFVLL